MVTIKKTYRGAMPSVPFERIADTLLGPRYELSLVVCGDALARRVNKEYRGKTYAANVLSFPYSRRDGEIFLNPRKAAREAPTFNHSTKEHLAFLFIHGCLHLKGLDHGPHMERLERQALADFGFMSAAARHSTK